MRRNQKRVWLLTVVALAGCASTTERLRLPALSTVEKVEVNRYLGTWYEIASFPQSFQKGCTATTATYSLRSDGDLDVLNKCHLETVDGELKVANGRARVVDPVTNARLEVSFFRPFWGDYWIIELDPDYQYAVVGHPGRDYLWILSRTAQMDPARYTAILGRLTEMGYPIDRLVVTLQPAPALSDRGAEKPL